jgi:hypothetical protein
MGRVNKMDKKRTIDGAVGPLAKPIDGTGQKHAYRIVDPVAG